MSSQGGRESKDTEEFHSYPSLKALDIMGKTGGALLYWRALSWLVDPVDLSDTLKTPFLFWRGVFFL